MFTDIKLSIYLKLAPSHGVNISLATTEEPRLLSARFPCWRSVGHAQAGSTKTTDFVCHG